MSWEFGHLQMFGYDLIVADPPWDFRLYSEAGARKSARAHYRTMPIEAIKAMRVGELARSDTLLLLYGITAMMPDCIETMRAWGFVYKSEIVWIKTTRKGKIRMGPGYRVRTMHEPILVGTIGNPQHKPFKSVIMGVAREHSRKPEEFYAAVESAMPRATKVELFSRTDRPGWDTWGDEVGKFNEEKPQGALF